MNEIKRCNFKKISHSMTSSQEGFDNRKKTPENTTTIDQSLTASLPGSNSSEDQSELIFSIDQRIDHLFCCI